MQSNKIKSIWYIGLRSCERRTVWAKTWRKESHGWTTKFRLRVRIFWSDVRSRNRCFSPRWLLHRWFFKLSPLARWHMSQMTDYRVNFVQHATANKWTNFTNSYLHHRCSKLVPHRVSEKKRCQRIFCSGSVKYELISMKIDHKVSTSP